MISHYRLTAACMEADVTAGEPTGLDFLRRNPAKTPLPRRSCPGGTAQIQKVVG